MKLGKITDLPKRSFLVRFAYYFFFFKLTKPGRYLFAGVIFSCMLGSGALEVPIFHFACALLALCTMTIVFGFLMRPKVEVGGEFPRKASAGQTVTGEFRLTNRSWFRAYDLSVGYFNLPVSLRTSEGAKAVASVGRGETASARVEIEPLKRGLYALPRVRAFTTFPFDLWRTGTRGKTAEGSLLVLPRFHRLDGVDLPFGRRYQPGGISLTSNVGESPEYIGNRDYRPGDSLRRIDFRSWGRLAKPVVREYQEEYYCRIALVLDTFVAPRRWQRARGFDDLEAAVSLSAAIADALAQGEYIIDIFAAGPKLHVFRAGRHTAHFESVLEILACVDACRTDPFEEVAPALAEELNRISSVVCVFLDWDAAREGLARVAVEAGCCVKILIVNDGETTKPVSDAEEWAESVTVLTPKDVFGGGLGVI